MMLAVTGAQTTQAADSSQFHDQWYMGAGPGITQLNPNTRNTGYSVADDADSGFKLFAGYDYDSNFSIEAFYATLGTAKLSDNGFASLNPNGEIDYATLGASALWYFWHARSDQDYTFRRGRQTYVHGGLSLLDNSSNVNYIQENSLQIHFGVGVEYGWDNGFALRGSIDSFDKDASLIAINLLKRFGREKTVIRDSDKDGISNTNDRCPGTPAGQAVDESGCTLILDSDADGVVDTADNCPDTAKGARVDAKGCAAKAGVDDDNDGVIDADDDCLGSPRGVPVSVRGCTIFDTANHAINFTSGSAVLVGFSKAVLNDLASSMLVLSHIKVEVQAHTDSQGARDNNKILSQARANSVFEYLKAQGVGAERMVPVGYGEEKSIATNETAEGRARNRRVEFRVINDDQ